MLLFALLVGVPILEIALFIQIGGWLGLWPTLGLVVLTALAGTILMRAQGLAALERLQRALAAGRDPVQPLADGAAVLIAGILLLTPGFFTDLLGLALLTPPLRARIIVWAGKWIAARAVTIPTPAARSHTTVDAEFEVVDSETRPAPGHPPSGWVRND